MAVSNAEVFAKLEEILRQVEELKKGSIGGGSPAYDRPPMLASEVIADSQTVNKDGSIWGMQVGGFSPQPGVVSKTATPILLTYGYISPRKCPRLWELAQKVLGTEQFAQWEADWKEHPFGIYNSNPADSQPNVSMDELVAITNAFIFAFRVHRIRDQVQ